MAKQKLTRLERVLLEILRGLRENAVMGPYARGSSSDSEAFKYNDQEGHFVHFAPWYTYSEREVNLERGMIVLCATSGLHSFTVAEIAEVYDNSHCLLRSLNNWELCEMHNEQFVPIMGLRESALLTDAQLEFRRKVIKAIRQLDDFWHRFGGIDFKDTEAIIWVRERHGGFSGVGNKVSLPYAVPVKWTNRLSIKAIRAELLEAGFGERKFEYGYDLKMIGTSFNVEEAVVTVDDPTKADLRWPVNGFLPYKITGGWRFHLITDLSAFQAIQLSNAARRLGSFEVFVKSENGDQFIVNVSGIKETAVRTIEGYWVESYAQNVTFKAFPGGATEEISEKED